MNNQPLSQETFDELIDRRMGELKSNLHKLIDERLTVPPVLEDGEQFKDLPTPVELGHLFQDRLATRLNEAVATEQFDLAGGLNEALGIADAIVSDLYRVMSERAIDFEKNIV